MLTARRGRRRARGDEQDEHGFTIIEVMVSTAILMIVLAMLFSVLVSLTRNEDRSQRLVSNEQNVRFELDQLAREIRASNPLVPLLNAATASTYNNQIEMVLGPTGGTQTVVRWTYDTTTEKMARQVMTSTAANATVVSQSFFLTRVRNVETGVPVFTYYGQQNEDLVAQSLANGGRQRRQGARRSTRAATRPSSASTSRAARSTPATEPTQATSPGSCGRRTPRKPIPVARPTGPVASCSTPSPATAGRTSGPLRHPHALARPDNVAVSNYTEIPSGQVTLP